MKTKNGNAFRAGSGFAFRKGVSAAFRKGFFFTVIAVVLLSFIIASIAAWSKVVSTREAKVAENFRMMSLSTALDASEGTITAYSQKALSYAIWKLDDRAMCAGIRPDSAAPDPAGNSNLGTGVISEDLAWLFVNGTNPQNDPSLGYSADEMQYSITDYSQILNDSASPTGISLWLESPRDVAIEQTDAWTAGISYNITLVAATADGSMEVRRNLSISTNVSLEGYVDPLSSLGDMSFRGVSCNASAKRQLFRNPSYSIPPDLSPVLITDENSNSHPHRAVEGKGWFYGNMTGVRVSEQGPGFNVSGLSQGILETGYYGNLTQDAPFYGGLIITSTPINNETSADGPGNNCRTITTRQTECVDCLQSVAYETINKSEPTTCPDISPAPFVYANAVDVPYIVIAGDYGLQFEQADQLNPSSTKYALFDNEHDAAEDKQSGYHRLYDIGKLRDATVCGYYVQNKDAAPSFFQRMLPLAASRGITSPYGIETFIIGGWAGGWADQPLYGAHDDYSRVDHEYYSGVSGTRIKGMPGCKSVAMCDGSNTNVTQYGVGHFMLSPGGISDYGVGKITCSTAAGSGARCDS